ncbi:phage tail protein [Hydrogenophaga sp.]|uniref:phage tail protein n=1 Tax=Hydrogenophaga sp. TaxID=1904254 RepID=UPI002731D5BA|nr:phage tail protein [Hydrogenophaga sp.]MDP2018334.1 phage tail protein [Hydrogenophaga sp.]MDP3167795.1 phage tail protein [Hydrogenophaga sp.]
MAIGAEFSASASASASAQVSIGFGERVAQPSSAPLIPFRFQVRFRQSGAGTGQGSEVDMCKGAFAECTGLEATMEPKVIRSGGVNHGAFQRAGQVTHATVVLKRGMTDNRHLWKWFALVSGGDCAARMDVDIDMLDGAGTKVMTWSLARCMPVKFKAADLNARATEVAVEELHLAHEGLTLGFPKA